MVNLIMVILIEILQKTMEIVCESYTIILLVGLYKNNYLFRVDLKNIEIYLFYIAWVIRTPFEFFFQIFTLLHLPEDNWWPDVDHYEINKVQNCFESNFSSSFYKF